MSQELKSKIEKLLKREGVREFYVNVYKSSQTVFDCVAHTTDNRAIRDAMKDAKAKAVHTIDAAYVTRLEEVIKQVPLIAAQVESIRGDLKRAGIEPGKSPVSSIHEVIDEIIGNLQRVLGEGTK